MAVYRANNRSLFTTNPRFGFQAYEYNNVNSGQKYVETVFNSNGIWTRPSHVSYIEILLVGGGGSGGGGTFRSGEGNRCAGGGGGGGIVLGKLYVANFDSWYVTIGPGGRSGAASGDSTCNNNNWGNNGKSSCFSPNTTSYDSNQSTINVNNYSAFAICANGGGGGGHPCGGAGEWDATGGGGGGSNTGTDSNFINHGGFGYRGGFGSGGAGGTSGGGGSMISVGGTPTGASGPTIWGLSNLGRGGNGISGGGSGAGGSGYGGGGGGGCGSNNSGGAGSAGVVVIRYFV